MSAKVKRLPPVMTQAPDHLDLSPDEKNMILIYVSHLVADLLPLARAIALDEFSTEDRDRLREQTGDWGVYNLMCVLRALSSESDREEMRSGWNWAKAHPLSRKDLWCLRHGRRNK